CAFAGKRNWAVIGNLRVAPRPPERAADDVAAENTIIETKYQIPARSPSRRDGRPFDIGDDGRAVRLALGRDRLARIERRLRQCERAARAGDRRPRRLLVCLAVDLVERLEIAIARLVVVEDRGVGRIHATLVRDMVEAERVAHLMTDGVLPGDRIVVL